MKTLFLTLRVFSATGGIEKVCRIMGKALYESSLQNEGALQICSMYDKQADAENNHYFPSEIFCGFNINKPRFLLKMVQQGAKSDVVILSHVNLLLIGWLIKMVSPATTVILLAHGVEVWSPFSRRRRKMLQECDGIIAVSNFTRDKIVDRQGYPADKCKVIHNCLDPFLPLPSAKRKKEALLNRYGFSTNDFILFTLTRISSADKYKGYDKVIEAMALLIKKYPSTKYLLAGKYDDEEKTAIETVINANGLQHHVVMPGYIPDDELQDHFAISDAFIMPSKGEGFGIAFIEAMYYGLPVIAGNEDGSTDALLDGRLGQLVSPDNVKQIAIAIQNVIDNRGAYMPSMELLPEHFSYETYKQKLEQFLVPYGWDKRGAAALN